MTTAQVIERLKGVYSSNRFEFEFNCSMLLAGDSNKNLRQAIVKDITGQDLPKSKCGMHYVSDILKASFEQITMF